MKNLLAVIVVLIFSSIQAQTIEYRMSESNEKQKKLESLQGGVLLRFDHKTLSRENMEGKKEIFWRCKELWIPSNTYTADVRVAIQKAMPEVKLLLLSGLCDYYTKKTKIDTLFIGSYKDIINFYEKKMNKLSKNQRMKVNKKLLKYIKKMSFGSALEAESALSSYDRYIGRNASGNPNIPFAKRMAF